MKRVGIICTLMMVVLACFFSCTLKDPQSFRPGKLLILLYFPDDDDEAGLAKVLQTIDRAHIEIANSTNQTVVDQDLTQSGSVFQGSFEVSAGSGYTILITCYQSSVLIYQGSRGNVTVQGGQTTYVDITLSNQLQGIQISPSSVTLEPGDMQQFTVYAVYPNSDTLTVTTSSATWSTSPGTAGSVSSSGLFTASSSVTGTETVTANYDGQEVTATVTVQSQTTVDIEWVTVDGGTFQMGSDSGDSNEQPIHTVAVSSFEISKYEVTNAQYASFLNATGVSSNGSYGGTQYILIDDPDCEIDYSGGQFVVESGKEDYPVIFVTWYGAEAFCEWAGGRLSTEAEWEFAARGGNQSQGYTYAGSNSIDEVVWYVNNSGGSTHPVGEKQPNELGIYDMSGNGYEFCNDWYDNEYYSVSPSNNPQGPSSGTYRVLRGGNSRSVSKYVRCTSRNLLNPEYGGYGIGFRCAR